MTLVPPTAPNADPTRAGQPQQRTGRTGRGGRNGGPPLPSHLPASLRRATHIPVRLREALAAASQDEQIRTVERLASTAGCDRRTLWSHWRHAFGRDSELRLQDFLHWLMLLRALHRKRAGQPWAAVAEGIGVHPHTLSRLARQLTGDGLRGLAERGHAELLQHFEGSVLPPLLQNHNHRGASGR